MLDKDANLQNDLIKLDNYSSKSNNYHVALSNPKFEYWLILHFVNITCNTAEDCNREIKNYLPNYNKSIDPKDFPLDNIKQAIENAKKRDNPPCLNCSQLTESKTTAYRLVENILSN